MKLKCKSLEEAIDFVLVNYYASSGTSTLDELTEAIARRVREFYQQEQEEDGA